MSCCTNPRDSIRPIRRAPRPVGCPCPHTSCECTTRFACNAHNTLLSLFRELEECNTSRGLLSGSCFTRIPISSARRVARSFLTLQFISPARLNLRPPLANAPKATKSTSARRARRLINLSALRRKREGGTPFYSAAFPAAFQDAGRVP